MKTGPWVDTALAICWPAALILISILALYGLWRGWSCNSSPSIQRTVVIERSLE